MERQTRGRRSHVTACRAAHQYSITLLDSKMPTERGVEGVEGDRVRAVWGSAVSVTSSSCQTVK